MRLMVIRYQHVKHPIAHGQPVLWICQLATCELATREHGQHTASLGEITLVDVQGGGKILVARRRGTHGPLQKV